MALWRFLRDSKSSAEVKHRGRLQPDRSVSAITRNTQWNEMTKQVHPCSWNVTTKGLTDSRVFLCPSPYCAPPSTYSNTLQLCFVFSVTCVWCRSSIEYFDLDIFLYVNKQDFYSPCSAAVTPKRWFLTILQLLLSLVFPVSNSLWCQNRFRHPPLRNQRKPNPASVPASFIDNLRTSCSHFLLQSYAQRQASAHYQQVHWRAESV